MPVGPGADFEQPRLARGAELGVEYPLPWERNAELGGQRVGLGVATASTALPQTDG